MIWFHAKTSLWHLWRLTPEGKEGKQWAECLETISNPVEYRDMLPTSRRGYFTVRVCARCEDFYRYIKSLENASKEN